MTMPTSSIPVVVPVVPTALALADRVARAFPPLACVRGYRYFARKRVTLVTTSESAIEADVKGTRTLRVSLRVAKGELASACTCSAKLLGPAACRHVWATLLEIDKQGLLMGLRTTARRLSLGVAETGQPRAAGSGRGKRGKR